MPLHAMCSARGEASNATFLGSLILSVMAESLASDQIIEELRSRTLVSAITRRFNCVSNGVFAKRDFAAGISMRVARAFPFSSLV